MIGEQLEFTIDGKSIIPHKWEIKVKHDEWCENPRTFENNLGKFLVRNTFKYVENEMDISLDDMGVEELADLREDNILYPVYVYDHSGWKMWIGEVGEQLPCKWDSGLIGWYVVPKEFEKVYQDLKGICKNEVKWYSLWANGQCFEFELYCDGEMVDTCAGYISDDYEELAKHMMEMFPENCDLTLEDVKQAIYVA